MISWHKYPFVRIFIPFAFGIWLGIVTKIQIEYLWLLLGIFASLLIAIFFSRYVKSYSLRWTFGFFIALSLVLTGLSFVSFNDVSKDKNNLLNIQNPPKLLVARVSEEPIVREMTTKVVLELQYGLTADNEIITTSGKVLTYFQKGDSTKQIKYGDVIAFSENPENVAKAGNPEQFDYKTYLANKGIYHQLFLKQGSWTKISENHVNPIYRISYSLRSFLLNVLQNNNVTGDEFGVASAILLGYDESLPAHLRKGYTAAGAMHVLCVSGMHVGVIFLIASFLLGFFGKKLWQRILKALLLLVLIWFYALLTGLSPSIQRSALMISFFLIGQLIGKKGFAINSIAASAFLILCLRPQNLFEIGFQLSYTAVLGIVIFQNWINGLLYFKIKILNKIWDITAVALAAQLGTTPLVLFYFNQFPTYFWLSNLFLVPLSFIIITLGMTLLVLSFIPFLSNWLGIALSGLVYVMNFIITRIESLPYSVFSGIYVSTFEFIMLILIVLCLVSFIRHHNQKALILMLVFGIFFCSSFTLRKLELKKNHSLIIYDLKKHSAIDFIYGNEHVLLSDSTILTDDFSISFSIEGYWTRNGLSKNPHFLFPETDTFKCEFLNKKKNLISFGNKLIVLNNKYLKSDDSLSFRPKADIYVVSKGQYPDLQKILNSYDIELLVLDGTVSENNTKKWLTMAKEKNISCYNIKEKGAFVLEVE